MQRIAQRTLQPAPVDAVIGVADQRLDVLAALELGTLQSYRQLAQ